MQVIIMRKETLLLQAESSGARNMLFSEFKECIAFAGSCEQFLMYLATLASPYFLFHSTATV